MDFAISEYLKERDKRRNNGSCKSCEKSVKWSRECVASHKRRNCSDDEGKRFFAKRKFTEQSVNNASVSDESLSFDGILIQQELTDEKIAEINTKLAKFFFRTGIPFRLAESGAFKELLAALNPAYAEHMPSAHTLSGTLLDQEYQHLTARRDKILQESKDLVLVSDGWTNCRGDHIVNFCVKAPDQKTFFYKSINTSGTRQNAEAVADAILSVIEELGSEKFSCLITDNAAVMRASWKIVEEKYPHIVANGCAAHVINLLIKDILSTPDHQKTIKESGKIIQFVNNHHMAKAKFEEKRKAAKIANTLSSPVSTRWFSQFTSSNNLLKAKYVLMSLADENSKDLKEIVPKDKSDVALKLMKSPEFWERLATLVETIGYPANVIGK